MRANPAVGGLRTTLTFMRGSRPPPTHVVHGAAFDLDVPLGDDVHAADAGYLALIFIDAAGREVQRRKSAKYR